MGVRYEKVVLDLEDRFTGPMTSATASTIGLERALKGLDGTSVRIRQSTSQTSKGLGETAVAADRTSRAIDQTSTSTRNAAKEIDAFSGRLRIAAQVASILGPGLVPIGAVVVPAVAALTIGLASAAVAGGSLLAAFSGVGDAVTAVNEHNLDPTVESFKAAQQALSKLGPEARSFVMAWDGFGETRTMLRDAAAAGWLPGLEDSLANLEQLAPRAADLLEGVGAAGGQAIEDATASLASDRWDDFLEFFSREAPQAITSLSGTVGDLTHGLAEMMIRLAPGSDAGLDWIRDVADNFDRWASSAQGRDDIEAFLGYVRETGPQVGEFFSSLVDTTAQVVQAAAPLGGPVLEGLTAVVDLIGTIAGSDLGTPILAGAAALSAYSRAATLVDRATASKFVTNRFPDGIRAAGVNARASVPSLRDFGNALAFSAHSNDTLARSMTSGSKAASTSAANAVRAREAVTSFGKSAAGVAAPVAGLALLTTGAADSMGVANTASLALMGTIGGPWGVALGAGVGAALDLAAANDSLADAVARADAAIASDSVGRMRQQLTELRSEVEGKSFLGEFFAEINPTDLGGFSTAVNKVRELQQAIDEVEFDPSQLGAVGNGLDLLAGPLNLTAQQFDRARLAGTAFFDMLGGAEKILGRRGEWRAYQAAIDATNQALRDNGATLNNNTAAGRANNAALDAQAQSALTFAQRLKGADRTNFLQGVRAGLVAAAKDFGLAAPAARKLANDLLGLGNVKVRPKADLDDNPLQQKLGRGRRGMEALDGSKASPFADLFDGPLQQGLGRGRAGVRQLDGTRANPQADLQDNVTGKANTARNAILSIPESRRSTITITTIRQTINRAAAGAVAGALGAADGGYIRGPGGPRDDVIPAWLSNGEFVVNAAATRRHLPYLHHINAQRYADGGEVTRPLAGSMFQTPSGFMGPGSEASMRAVAASDMAARASREAGKAFGQLAAFGKAEQRQRGKLLEQAVTRAEKEQGLAKERWDAIREETKALRESVKTRLTSDLFGQPAERFDVSLPEPEDFGSWSAERQIAWMKMEQERDRLHNGAIDAANTPVGRLRADIAGAREFDQLEDGLRGQGLRGGALRYLLEQGDTDYLRELVEGPRRAATEFANLFNERNRVIGAAGRNAAQAVNGQAERVAAAAYREQTAELKQARREQRQYEKRQERREERMQQLAEDAPTRTGEAVGEEINGAMLAGSKGRAR